MSETGAPCLAGGAVVRDGTKGSEPAGLMPEFDWEGAEVTKPNVRIEDGAGGIWDLDEQAGLPGEVGEEIRRGTVIAHGARPFLRLLVERGVPLPSAVICTEAAAGLLAAGCSDAMDLEAVSERYVKVRPRKDGGVGNPAFTSGESAHLLRLAGVLRRTISGAALGRVFDLEMQVLPLLATCDVHGLPVDRARLVGLRDGFLRGAGESLFRLGELLCAPTLDPENAAQLERVLARAGIRVRSTGDAALLQANEGKIIPELLVFRRKSALARWCQELLGAARSDAGGTDRIPSGGFLSTGSKVLDELVAGSLAEALQAPGGRRLVVHRTDGAAFAIALAMCPGPKAENVLDPHRATATWIFQKPTERLEEDERRVGRVVNDALVLGLGADTMAGEILRNGLRLPGDPQEIRKAFFFRHPGIAKWHEACQRQARERRTEARTPLGRRSVFSPGANTWQRFSGLVATVVHGGSEEAVKSAAVRLVSQLPATARLVGLTARAICVECAEEEAEAVGAMVGSTWNEALQFQHPAS